MVGMDISGTKEELDELWQVGLFGRCSWCVVGGGISDVGEGGATDGLGGHAVCIVFVASFSEREGRLKCCLEGEVKEIEVLQVVSVQGGKSV